MTLERIVQYFEALQPADLSRIGEVYADDAYFKDPFNEVQGVAAIRAIYGHMFDALATPRFVVLDRWTGAQGAVLRWHFSAEGMRGHGIAFEGLTQLTFAADGRISIHRDYWDPAEAVYAKVPLLGALLRLVKRRLRAPTP